MMMPSGGVGRPEDASHGRTDPGPGSPKVSRPHVGPSRVHRPRLTAMLDTGVRRRVTLVSAGPGWGKTTLVSAWAAARRTPVAWLTLDGYDNDPRVFAGHVLAALRSTTAGRLGAGGDGTAADDVGHIRSLGRVLHQLPTPMVLVLDDFDAIDNRQLARELDELLRAPRTTLRIVMITRSGPVVPLHRLRAAGELSEIRADDLAFTADEAAALLAGRGVTASPDEVASLVRRTDGWAVGLQMAAAFLTGPAGGSVADFSGDVRSVDDYLTEEVLDRQPPQRRTFLLYTSICDHLCGGLADAITGENTGQRTLEELEHVNQFVVRLDSHPTWFRYHHLIRDVLQHHLAVDSPEMLPEVHRRAAGWYARHGSDIDALGHAVAAQDWAYVGRLVVEAAPMILSRDRGRLVTILEQIPAEQFAGTAGLMVCEAILLFDGRDYAGVRDRLDRAQRALTGRSDPDRPAAEIAIRALKGAVNRVDGDMAAMLEDTTSQLTSLAHVPLARLSSTFRYRAVALNNKGVALLWTGRPEAAERYLSMGSAAARSAGLELVEINALGHQAVLEVMFGSVREAERLVRAALDKAKRGDWTTSMQVVAAHHAAALVELEHGRPVRAERALRQASRAHRSDPEAPQWKVSLGIGARLAMVQDRLPNALAFLDELHRSRFPRARTPMIDRWLRVVGSEADLLAGRPDRVRQRYRAQNEDGTLSLPERNVLIRAALAERDLGTAEALLTETGSVLSETVATVEARILGALVLEAAGRGLDAGEMLGKAIAVAAPEGVRRPFVSLAGGRLGPLLARQSLLSGDHASFIADILQLLGTPGRTSARPVGVSALSERETEVLHYLPTMLTAAEIGEELGVSVNTIKAHMRAIYRKLGTPRRRQAVARAREQGLV
jgi:LuxR family maltose regulon positive regulatory protein